jgi:serine/threonine-protein phosphatase 2A regulatory subunit A
MANKNDVKAIQPISTMIDELKSDDVKKRVNSVKNLSAIATALGPERTRNELIGFLNGELYIFFT